MASITLRQISKSFESYNAVYPLDLEIRDGEFFTLLGPSGCGKTTLLRMLAGLEKPTTGRILLDADDVGERPPRDRDIALVFQDYALYPHLSVRENLAFPLRAKRHTQHDIDRKLADVADRLQLQSLLDRRPRQLSGGQQQRVALGRAIVRNPKAFLMDEPLSNLDAKLRVGMRAELKRLQRDLGITTVYVTHDQEEAMTMSDRIAVMREGVIQQCAAPAEVYRAPANVWVGSFVGSPAMNVFEVDAVAQEGATLLVSRTDHSVNLLVTERLSSGRLTVGVRPEHFVIHERQSGGSLPSMVDIVELVGDHHVIVVKTGIGILTVKSYGDQPPAVGETVFLSVQRSRLHVFSPETGARIAY